MGNRNQRESLKRMNHVSGYFGVDVIVKLAREL